MRAFEPRVDAVIFLLVALAASLLLCRFWAARSPRPAILWTAGGYWTLLHLVFLYGLLAGSRFEDGLALLTLFTFPLSALVSDTHSMPGFSTLPDLARNYLSFGLCGAVNALFIAGFFSFLLPRRIGRRQQHAAPR